LQIYREFTFISVTTKARNVFYILIDHRIPADDENGEANVYFLTKVNEYDLLSLLYVPAEDAPPPPVHPALTQDTQNSVSPDIQSGDIPDRLRETPNRASFNFFGIPPFIVVIVGIILVGLMGFGVYMYMNGRKKNPKVSALEDDDIDDDDSDKTWDDDDEVDIED
jgi:hypothetical protein